MSGCLRVAGRILIFSTKLAHWDVSCLMYGCVVPSFTAPGHSPSSFSFIFSTRSNPLSELTFCPLLSDVTALCYLIEIKAVATDGPGTA
ncbi:hypothetical protein ACP4OV_007083 [Aristida adscensionis]